MWLVTQPLRHLFENAVSVAHGLAQGDVHQQTGEISSDEIGDFNTAFQAMIGYQQRMAAVADAIADGDLTVQIAPMASTDRLGIATSNGAVDPVLLQRQADIALYVVKRRGRDSVVAYTDANVSNTDQPRGELLHSTIVPPAISDLAGG